MFTTRSENVAAELAENCLHQGWVERPAYLAGGTTVTHGELHDRAARFAALLRAWGIDPGSRVMIVLPDCVELVWAFLGAIRHGCTAVLINPALTRSDHQAMVVDCDPALVVCPTGYESRFPDRAAVASGELECLIRSHSPAPPIPCGNRAPVYAQYTSGTTGRPKAVLHGHRGLLVYRHAFLDSVTRVGQGEVTYSANKMCYSYGLGNSLFTPLLTGCTTVLDPSPPDSARIAELLIRHQVDVLSTIPSVYARLLFEGQGRALRDIRLAVTAAEPLPAVVADRFASATSASLLNHIGSTEVGQPFASNGPNGSRDGTVGRVLPSFAVRVVDEQGRELPVRHVGTLQIRGPATTLGYLGRPELSEELYDGGWMRSNDLGCFDEDGFLRLFGRIDDVEICAGMNVYPLEVEEALYRHPNVAQAAVCAVNSAAAVNELWAFVVPHSGSGSDTLHAELISLVRGLLAEYKTPQRIIFVPNLPRNSNGKVNRAALRVHEPPADSPPKIGHTI